MPRNHIGMLSIKIDKTVIGFNRKEEFIVIMLDDKFKLTEHSTTLWKNVIQELHALSRISSTMDTEKHSRNCKGLHDITVWVLSFDLDES